VVNVGLRPTVAENIVPTIETHCLGADCDFYGQEMRVRFVQEIRSERKFASMELLREQIAADSETAAKILL
jgi:riboflavin kinase/FMN adenylyltransferase